MFSMIIERPFSTSIQLMQPNFAKLMDEAAAIPLPLVKSLLVPYLVFMVSTVNGYTKQTNVYLLEAMKEQDDLCLLSKLNNDV